MQLVFALLVAGALPVAQNNIGQTPLHIAALNQSVTALDTLIEYCTNNTKLYKRRLDLDVRDMFGATALHNAMHVGNSFTVRILLKAGASLTVQDNQGTGAPRCTGHIFRICRYLIFGIAYTKKSVRYIESHL